jgi:two-component system alkaline phosphatase synthesis response regulator PhoP
MPSHVLLVDDEPMLLSCLRLYLEEAGYQVTSAGNGTAALDQIHANPPDVLVCDLFMPDMNGLDLCEKVRQNPEWQDIDVVLLTARLERSHVQALATMGIRDYLIKPFEPEALLLALKNGKPAHARS